MKKTTIIAEIGLNHSGDINTALKLIDVAHNAGCDVVKFQKRNPHVCVPEEQKGVMRDTPWGRMTYLDYKLKIEFQKPEYDIIDEHCKKIGIQWSASPWDVESLDFICEYDIPWIKIPSAMITDKELMSYVLATYRKIIVSTGMSTIQEISSAVEQIRRYHKDFVLMHCNSSYPAPIEELNLSAISTLKQLFGCEVGYSGHEFRIGTSVAAIYLGATYIERHITLDRSAWGTDQLCSVEPQGLMKLVSGIRELEAAFGDGVIRVTESEKEVRKKLRK